MDVLVQAANTFIGLFEQGGKTFVWMLSTFVPLLICLITFFNAIIKFVGQERIFKLARYCSGNLLLRYTVLPFLTAFFLTSPTVFHAGKLLKEKHKPAFYDSAVSFIHPITGLFPHANTAELFVFLGIAAGIKQLGLSLGPLALYYLLTGILVILMRGIVTQIITAVLLRRSGSAQKETV